LEWTPDNRLRHPRFVGVRSDKDARHVRANSRLCYSISWGAGEACPPQPSMTVSGGSNHTSVVSHKCQ
jgi:hypothetical protein